MTATLLNFCVCLASPCLASERSLIVGVYQSAPPYISVGPERQPIGIQIDLLRAVAKQQNYKLEFRMMPHGRLAQELILGNLDLALLAVMPKVLKFPASDSLVIADLPVYIHPLNIYSSNRNPTPIENFAKGFTVIGDFHAYRIGFKRLGLDSTHATLEDLDNVVFFTKYSNMIKSMMAGRIELAALGPVVADFWNERLSAGLQLQKETITSVPVHAVFSQKALEGRAVSTCENFWKGLLDIQLSGELEDILSDYQHTELISYIAPRRKAEKPNCQVQNYTAPKN